MALFAVRPWMLRLVGWVRLGGWAGALYLVDRPWRNLGGCVTERLRWLEKFALMSGLLFGITVGWMALDLLRPGTGRRRGTALRFLFYPATSVAAVTMATLAIVGFDDPIGVVLTAIVAYGAGVDVSFGAIPLIDAGTLRSSSANAGFPTRCDRG